MKIILLRHGEPDIDTGLKVSPREYGVWLKAFNLASIKDSCPPVAVMDLVRQCEFVVCSDLARSIDSARALGIEHIDVLEPLFREFEVSYSKWLFPKLPASSWTVLFRLMWLTGYSANAESFRVARQRTVLCMQRLVGYAEQYGTVLFVGHGSLFWYLTRLLVNNGWQGPTFSPKKYWEFCVYHSDRD